MFSQKWLFVIMLCGLVLGWGVPVSQAQNECVYHVDTDPATLIALYAAPINVAHQQLALLPRGSEYSIMMQNGRYFYLSSDELGLEGWVHALSLGGSTTGDCTSIPMDIRALTEFSTVCFFTATTSTPLGSDPAMSPSPFGSIDSSRAYMVNFNVNGIGYVQIDDASGGWVQLADGQLTGDCDTLSTQAFDRQTTTATDARLWSVPDVRQGAIVGTVPVGTTVEILQPPMRGAIRFDTEDKGYWYKVTDGTLEGWVWEGRLTPLNP